MTTCTFPLTLEIPPAAEQVLPVGHQIFRGVRVLDQFFGAEQWRARVDTVTLDMSNTNCMLHQLFGNYGAGCCELELNPFSKEPFQYGFNVRDLNSPTAAKEFKALTYGWRIASEITSALDIWKIRAAA